jgi:hypothetical protein
MRRILPTTLLALLGLLFGLGADQADPDGRNVFLIYSSDERSELHPCG